MTKENLELIWNALSFYREHGIPEGNEEYDQEWSDIVSCMWDLLEQAGYETGVNYYE